MVHEEVPAVRGRELHGIQIFVNLSSHSKLTPPRVLHLDPADVPEWRSETGDRVRVVAGSFGGLTSPLVPAEPFTLLDVHLRHEMSLAAQPGHTVLVYVLSGYVAVSADGHQEKVEGGHALALRGSGGRVMFEAFPPSHFLIVSGAEIREPVVSEGPLS